MENIDRKQTDDNFIDIEEFNLLFCHNFGPKLTFRDNKLAFNKSVDSLDDLDFISILNSVEVMSSKDNESQGNSIADIAENKDDCAISVHKIKTMESFADKKSHCGCFKKKRLKTFDSYYSTNVNNTKRSSNFSKSIKLNDSLTKFRKKKGTFVNNHPPVRCGCTIF
jgi:hypothetical protein